MDPVTAGFLFATEFLKFLQSRPADLQEKGWRQWDAFWEWFATNTLKLPPIK